ncbi:MFS transporter [Nocardioides cavernae]|uniref:MFS transporter n=1 Tax=Nocardioides cavernae TaxID=1921566 RepID=A0ABR8NE27_9ACTN|nr:MFS transporter [Nocardioides cavernae]MBD3926388.1 MFS transporter [Nocardioides cavernae]MBM7512105.1 EmrB/QacA subfamily drug resistance transporter [Nocardioides cavernae]
MSDTHHGATHAATHAAHHAAHHAPHHGSPHGSPHPAPGPEEEDGPRRPWTVLAVALAAQILVVLDISVVNTALPTIGRSLDIDGGNLQWLVTAYVMMSGGGLLLGGRLSDLLSRRGVFLTGLTLFTAASIVSGFAGSTQELIAARAVQGLSAALLTPSALSLITTTYAGAQRRTALALWGVVGSLGVAAGVLLGGAVTTWTSWQFIFWINGPVGVVALLVGTRTIAKEPVARPRLADLDLPGATAVIGGLVALTYALGATATHGWWSAHTVVAMAVSAVLLVAFLTVERSAAKPLFPPHVWKLKALVSGTAVMLGITGLLVGAVFLISIFVQTVLGYTALQTGVAFLPFALAITAGTVAARHLLGHVAPRVVAAVGLVVTGTAAVLLSVAGAGAEYAVDLLPGLVIMGVGVGMVFVPVSVTSMAGIPSSHAGVASGFLMTGHEVGAALGVAVLSAVASTAGSLATVEGAADAFRRGFTCAAVIAAVVAAYALWRMPAQRVTGAIGHMHH